MNTPASLPLLFPAPPSANVVSFGPLTLPAAEKSHTTTTVRVTPEFAAAWLERNRVNRRLRKEHVKMWERYLREGFFQNTHQGIAFNKAGFLIDGQHRLTAIVNTGITAVLDVTIGLEDAAFAAIDTNGLKRTLADSTGYPREVTEACSAIYQVASGTSLSPALAAPYLTAFGQIAFDLTERHGARTKNLTAASVRAAVVLRASRFPTQREYIFRLYGALSVRDYANMPPIVHSLVRQLDAGATQVNRRDGTTLNRFDAVERTLRTWRALDPENASTGKLQLMTDTARGECKEAIEQALNSPWTGSKRRIPAE